MTADGEKTKRNDIKDDLIKDYDAVIRESALLTTVSGFLFGFLLNISINTPKGFTAGDSIVIMIALFSITFAVSFFAMPVVYHHLQYPYRDLEKFKLRNHKFVKFDIVPAALTLYLGLDLGLDLGLKLGFPSINTDYLQSYVLLYPSHLSLYSSEKESDDMYTQLSSKSVCAD